MAGDGAPKRARGADVRGAQVAVALGSSVEETPDVKRHKGSENTPPTGGRAARSVKTPTGVPTCAELAVLPLTVVIIDEVGPIDHRGLSVVTTAVSRLIDRSLPGETVPHIYDAFFENGLLIVKFADQESKCWLANGPPTFTRGRELV